MELELNEIQITGNLAADPLERDGKNGPYCRMRLASNRHHRDKDGVRKDDVCFVTVLAFDECAQFCRQKLKIGDSIYVKGELRHEEWRDEKSGERKERHYIVAQRVHFVREAQKQNYELTERG